jgi:5'-nucleotidase/UDP-sugar diphosphatase
MKIFFKTFNSLTVTIIMTISVLLYSSLAFAASPTNDVVALQILTINDFHGALIENGKNPGAAKIASYLENAKAENPNGTLLLSAGDMFQGSPDSNLLYGKTVVEFMNTVGFDAMTIGNHEFDWGIDLLKQRITQSHFPYVSANIFDKNSNKNVDFVKPYVIVEREGVKIAIIGIATPETAYKSNPKVVSSYRFEDPATIVNTLKPELVQKGVDIIIVLCHLSSFMDKNTGEITGDAADLAMNAQGINVIVSGHSHQRVYGTVNNIPIVQAQYFGRAVGKINLLFNRSTKQVLLSGVDSIVLPVQGLTANPQVQAIIEKSQTEIAPVKKVILGKTVTELTHDREVQQVSLLGQWTTDIMRETANADIAFTNAGGLRISIPAGNITMGTLYEVMPFDNTLFTLDMTGSQVMKVLEHGIGNKGIGMVQFSGIKVVYTTDAPTNQRIALTMNDDTPFDVKKTYKVVTNDFMAAGGDQFTMFAEGKNRIDTNIPLRDMFMDTLKKIKTIHITNDNRFIINKPIACILPAVA